MNETKRKDGGPAFPKVPDDIRNGSSGMSLRDWFAGQVIGPLISDPAVADAANLAREAPARIACIAAYEIADAMLAAREEGR